SDPRTPAASASAVLTTTANFVYGVALSTLTPDRSAYPGDVVTYTLRVTNTSNAADTVRFSRRNAGWPTAFSATSLNIAAGGWRTVVVTVTVPLTATDNEQDAAEIVAQGSNGPAQVVLTTTAIWRKVYLPLVLRAFGP
ncbi:MAG: hypothetical protein ACUVSG_09600, partial [Anaerolineae bacterium]